MQDDELPGAVARRIANYRAGEIPRPDAEHVNRWAAQFDPGVQGPLLRELHHVLGKVYFSRARVDKVLERRVVRSHHARPDFSDFWRRAELLEIQRRGRSQTDMLTRFDHVLRGQCGFGREGCKGGSGVFVYLDDAIFTGNRVRYDLQAWLADAPRGARVFVFTIAFHLQGQGYAHHALEKAASKLGKSDIRFHWDKFLELKDHKSSTDRSDVLRPTAIPDDPGVQAYANKIGAKYPIVLRRGNHPGRFFSSHEGRVLLEQELLTAGVRIRERCPHLGDSMQPLGFSKLSTLGFGTLFATYRNCPNNCPLALWAGDPWYPLLPRRTN